MGGCRTHLEHEVSHETPPLSLLLADSLSLQESIRTVLPCAPRHHQPCLVSHSVPHKRAIQHKAADSMESTLTGQVYNHTKSADLCETTLYSTDSQGYARILNGCMSESQIDYELYLIKHNEN